VSSIVRGFWEQNSYHLYGHPWKEQRFDSDGWPERRNPLVRRDELEGERNPAF
jgi:DMSO/TMAO reductase YedYZ molybdopterin-dependent catalytic subunit